MNDECDGDERGRGDVGDQRAATPGVTGSRAWGVAESARARQGWNRGRGVAFGSIWLIFLTVPVSGVFDRHPEPVWRILAIVVAVVFAAVYLAMFGASRHGARVGGVPVAYLIGVGLCALAVVMCLLGGQTGMFTLIYLAAAGMTILQGRAAAVWFVVVMVAVLGIPLVVPGWHPDVGDAIAVGMSAIASWGFSQLIRRNAELVRAHEEIARLAVAEERSRFARDLHDILGHSLTVITVKAELAGKLVDRAPDRAVTEIRDVERLAREALADVRATAAGVREPSLAAELGRARQALSAAGIAAELPNTIEEVPGGRRNLFGWVVREGVTNVVRHSRARTCRVELTPTSVTVVDDGAGPDPARCAERSGAERSGAERSGAERSGADEVRGAPAQGLAGLRERVEAAGGMLEAGPATTAGSGFRLRVTLGEPAPRDRSATESVWRRAWTGTPDFRGARPASVREDEARPANSGARPAVVREDEARPANGGALSPEPYRPEAAR